ncbi:hypothetical protein ANMWB30_23710 [Arthrobacter sp. MWB30]|nr:hypothetical protein ANMWB30_23710 [Arthrobacter sp. MWB30]
MYEALGLLQITRDDVRARFVAGCRDERGAAAAWQRLERLDNPSAAELGLYAQVLHVNTTWLLTGDMRFINIPLMGQTCLCRLLPEEHHYVHYGITEPGSTHEYNPGCLVHGPAMDQERRRRTVLMDLILGRRLGTEADALALPGTGDLNQAIFLALTETPGNRIKAGPASSARCAYPRVTLLPTPSASC